MGLRYVVTTDAFLRYLESFNEGKFPRKDAQKKLAKLSMKRKRSPKEEALLELFQIAIADKEIGFERSPFHKQQERTIEIGERLNALGGFELMLWAHQQFSRTDGNSLELVWHGIGEWIS
jgi:hypothetical protein